MATTGVRGSTAEEDTLLKEWRGLGSPKGKIGWSEGKAVGWRPESSTTKWFFCSKVGFETGEAWLVI